MSPCSYGDEDGSDGDGGGRLSPVDRIRNDYTMHWYISLTCQACFPTTGGMCRLRCVHRQSQSAHEGPAEVWLAVHIEASIVAASDIVVVEVAVGMAVISIEDTEAGVDMKYIALPGA